MKTTNTQPLPMPGLAAPGLLSYRLKDGTGWIMIDAKDDDDAVAKALRAINHARRVTNLQRWGGVAYVPCATTTEELSPYELIQKLLVAKCVSKGTLRVPHAALPA